MNRQRLAVLFSALLPSALLLPALGHAKEPTVLTQYTITSWLEGCDKPAKPADVAKDITVEYQDGGFSRGISVFTPVANQPGARRLLAAFGGPEADGDGPYAAETSESSALGDECRLEKGHMRLTVTKTGLKLELDAKGLTLKQASCTPADLEAHANQLKCTQRTVIEAVAP